MVDDDPSLLEMGVFYLGRAEGFEVTTLRSAQEVEALIAERRFDAIVCEYIMPGMSGIDLLVRLRASNNDIPFIMFTAVGEERAVMRALELGADFFVQKGESIRSQFADLVRMIEESVALRRATHALSDTLRRFHTVSEGVPCMIVSVDSEGLITECNGRTTVVVGSGPDSLRGRHISELIEDVRAESRRDSVPEMCLTSELSNRECMLIRGNGTRIDVLVSSSPLRCANEGDTAAVLIMNDMAEVRRARVELQSAEKRYKFLEAHVSDFITGRDPELKYDDIDKAS